KAFLEGLRDLGYVVGRTIIIEYRSAAWNRELLPDLAAELVELKVDVLVAVGDAVDAAKETTKTIPIVIPAVNDPVETGLVDSLARPGGNITGTAWATAELATFRCKTQTIDSVFIRGGDVGTRPNAPIFLTIGAVIRDREGAARDSQRALRGSRGQPPRRQHGAASVPATQSRRSPPPRRSHALGLYPSADRHAARRRCPRRSCGGGSGAASSPESAPGPTGDARHRRAADARPQASLRLELRCV